MLSQRENYIRAVRRTGPEWIPCRVAISDAAWYQFKGELEEVVLRHPLFFPGFRKGARDWKTWRPYPMPGDRETDPWGVEWHFDSPGLDGAAVGHPLDDWSKFQGFQAPDPLRFSDRHPRDLRAEIKKIAAQRAAGELAEGMLDHGYFLMRLWYLRGFENLMLDIAGDEPRLASLSDLLVERNNAIVAEHVKAGVDVFQFQEDIGTQTASILSPAAFRKWVVPAYRRMMRPVKDAGIIVGTHSDGYILELVDDLLACGCDILNPQDLCNGIDNIARAIKGRCCIELDVDRQQILPFGSRREIQALIEEEVRKLGAPEGGLMFICGIYPPTPPANVDAVCGALTKYRAYWKERG
jgi:hypothetical protein